MATGGKFVISAETSEEYFEFACSPCAADGRPAEGIKYCVQCDEYLCSRCVKDHGRFAALKSHSLQDTAAMTGSRQPQPSSKFVPTEKCSIHHGNLIDTYCGNHDVVCCGTCVSVNHRSCVDITYIVDAAVDVTKSQEYKSIKGTITKVQSQLQQLKKSKQDELTILDKDKSTCLTMIKDFRNKLNSHLDQLEKDARDNVQTKHKEYEDKVNADIATLEHMLSTLGESIDKLKKVNTANEPQVFVYTKLAKQNQNVSEKVQKEMTTATKQERLNYNINTTLADVIMDVKTLGELLETGDTIYTHSLRGHYNVKVKDDSDNCDITGSCLLPDGTLLITDWDNNKLKRLDQSYKVTDWCNFPDDSRPYGVCAAGAGVAAVTLRRHKKIQFVSVGQTMALTKSFNVGHNCWGIAYISGELLVGCNLPGQVCTYTTDGTLLRTFQTGADGQQMFSKPWHIAVSTDNTLIYFSDRDNGIITLDHLSNKVSQFSDPDRKDTRCVYPETSGQLFVCNFKSNNIQVGHGGQKLGVLLDESDGVMKPKSLWYDSAKSRLIVTMKSAHIAVFNLSRK